MLELLLGIYTPILAGVLLGLRLKPGERELSLFSKVVLYVFLPALLFHSTYTRLVSKPDPRLANLAILSGASVILTYLATKLLREPGEVVLASMYANAGYLPVGIAQTLYGDLGVSSVGFYILGNNATSNFLASLLARRYKSAAERALRTLLFPPVTAITAAATLWAAKIPLPGIVLSLVRPFANSAPILALVQLGLEFSAHPSLDVTGVKAYAYRLSIVVPLTLLFAKGGLLAGVDRNVAVIESVMPSAVSCVPISRGLGFDSGKTARLVFTSTLLATAVSLPVVLALLAR